MIRIALFVGAIVAMTRVASSAEPPLRPIQINDLYRFRRVSDTQLNPEGTRVVYVVSEIQFAENSSHSNLWLANYSAPHDPKPLTRANKKDGHPRWSPDGRWILFESNRSGSSQLWAISVEGGEALPLTDVVTGAGTAIWSPDGKRIAFVSNVIPEFSELPFAEGNLKSKSRLEEIEKNPVSARVHSRLFFRHWDSYVEGRRQHLFVMDFDPETGTAGEPRDVTPGDRDANPTSMTFSVGDDYCFSPDGSHLVFTAVPAEHEAWSTNHDLCRVSVAGGQKEWQRLGQFSAAEGAPVFSPDGTQLAFRAQSVPDFEADKWDVFVVNCQPDGAWTSEPVCLTRSLDRSAETLYWSTSQAGTPEVSFLCQDQGRVIRFATSPSADQKYTEYPESTTIEAMSFSRDGQNYVFLGSRLNQPPEVFSTGGCISNCNMDALRSIRWGALKSVTVQGFEGAPMQMWVLTPPSFDPDKKWPLVYLVHGGPQGAWADGWSNRWNPQVWAAQGYVVALPNPRGSTGFGQKYANEISGDWGGKCYEDLMLGVTYLESLPYIDGDRMCAAGASFGGYMMNWFQGKTTRFRTLITHCGVYNFDSMYATTEELWFDEYEHGGPPWGENRHSYDEHSPHRHAKNFQTPMLIIHNDLDFRVPVSEGFQLFTTLQRLGVPSKMIQFPDEGHWVSKPANGKFWHEQIFAWLQEYCPPGAR